MLSCINKNSKLFRDLVLISGLSESTVEAYCRYYSDKFGRFPYLDELPNSNSEPNLRETLNVTKIGAVKVNKLLDYSKKSDIQSAILEINNIHRDLEVEATLISNEDIILEILHKPKMYSEGFLQLNELINGHSHIILDTICDKLLNLYGVDIVPITNSEINNNPELSKIPDVLISKAFIYNNVIYINTNNATIDSKVHELLHLLFATMRNVNPELYFSLISKAEKFSNFNNIAVHYPNRTQNDLLEEVFVTELSRYLAGLNSSITELSEAESNEIHYQITRILDISLEGELSTRCIPEDELYSHTLGKIGLLVNSPVTSYKFYGSLDETKIHRILANTKSRLLKDKRLKEICE